MKTILIIAAIFCVYKILAGLSARQKEAARKSEAERIRKEQESIRAEQARQREQIRASIERAKIETHERIEAEKRRIEWQKRQDAINRQAEADRIRLEKEQARQAEQLSELSFRIAQAEADIEAWRERVSSLYAIMDLVAAQQAQATPGSADDERAQRKIIALQDQIHTTERKIAKAEYDKETAQRKRTA